MIFSEKARFPFWGASAAASPLVNSAGSTLGCCEVLVWEVRDEFAGCRDSSDDSTCETCGTEGAPNKYDGVLVGACRLNAGSRLAASCRVDATVALAAPAVMEEETLLVSATVSATAECFRVARRSSAAASCSDIDN